MWFKNTLAHTARCGRTSRRVSSGRLSSGESDDSSDSSDDEDAPLKRVIAHFGKAIKGRALSGSILWGRKNKGDVQKKMVGSGIGSYMRALKLCFEELPAEQQAFWREKAKAEAASHVDNPLQCFECVQAFLCRR